MNEVLLDTDILSYFFRGHPQVLTRAEAYLLIYPRFNLSLITYYEILSGLQFKQATRQSQIFDTFVEKNRILGLTEQTMRKAAEIYALTRQQGTPVDDIDILIASTALEYELTLVTNNQRHFEKIPDLRIENWATI